MEVAPLWGDVQSARQGATRMRKTQYDDKLAADEASRLSRYESIKDNVRGQVDREIERRTVSEKAGERASERAVADSLKRRAVREVAATDIEIERAKGIARVSQVVDYLFLLIYGVIGLAIALELLGAREGAPFKQFIDALAAPLLSPFRNLMPDPGIGPYRLMLSYIMALVVYALLHAAINGLLRLFVHRKTAV